MVKKKITIYTIYTVELQYSGHSVRQPLKYHNMRGNIGSL